MRSTDRETTARHASTVLSADAVRRPASAAMAATLLASALVVMVILTTLITPIALKLSLGRRSRRGGPAAPPG